MDKWIQAQTESDLCRLRHHCWSGRVGQPHSWAYSAYHSYGKSHNNNVSLITGVHW